MTKVYLFCSRNKDNKEVPNFKERRKAVFCNDGMKARVMFERFKEEGVAGEFCRCYESVNARDEAKAKKALVCRLVMDDNVTLDKVESLAVSLAMKPENAAEKKWLFDFDCDDCNLAQEFCNDVKKFVEPVAVNLFRSPNGYSVVVKHGFDTRELLEKWNKLLQKQNPNWTVELKRDAMLPVRWGKKTEG